MCFFISADSVIVSTVYFKLISADNGAGWWCWCLGGTLSTMEVFTTDIVSLVGCGTFYAVTSHRSNAASSSRSFCLLLPFIY